MKNIKKCFPAMIDGKKLENPIIEGYIIPWEKIIKKYKITGILLTSVLNSILLSSTRANENAIKCITMKKKLYPIKAPDMASKSKNPKNFVVDKRYRIMNFVGLLLPK